MKIHLPNKCKRHIVELNTFTKIVESYFGHSVYEQEIPGCVDHPQSGAMTTEILESSPECFVVVITRIENRNDDQDDEDDEDDEVGTIYITRTESCQIPNRVSIETPYGNQTYDLFGIINWDGYASPTTGSTNGHYTADIKFNNTWFSLNDSSPKCFFF